MQPPSRHDRGKYVMDELLTVNAFEVAPRDDVTETVAIEVVSSRIPGAPIVKRDFSEVLTHHRAGH